MARNKRGKRDDRLERVNTDGAHGDMRAGDEGLDDSAMSRGHRDDMSATPMQGDRLREGFSGQGAQKEGNMEEAEGTGYTNDESMDESSDESTTSRNRRENPLS